MSTCASERSTITLLFGFLRRFVDPFFVRDIGNHIAPDGIHLLPEGKFLLANSIMGVEEQPPPKPLSWSTKTSPPAKNEFPPLRCDSKGNPLQPLDVGIASLEAKRRESRVIRKTIMAIDSSFRVAKSGRRNFLPASSKVETLKSVTKALAIIVEKKTKKKKIKKKT